MIQKQTWEWVKEWGMRTKAKGQGLELEPDRAMVQVRVGDLELEVEELAMGQVREQLKAVEQDWVRARELVLVEVREEEVALEEGMDQVREEAKEEGRESGRGVELGEDLVRVKGWVVDWARDRVKAEERAPEAGKEWEVGAGEEGAEAPELATVQAMGRVEVRAADSEEAKV